MRKEKYVHIIRIINYEETINNQIGKLKRHYSNSKDFEFNPTHLRLIKTIKLN